MGAFFVRIFIFSVHTGKENKAVLTLLNDEEWSEWSDNEISKKCEVSQPTVSKYRKEVESSYKDYKIESSRKVKRGDQEYTVDTNQYSYE